MHKHLPAIRYADQLCKRSISRSFLFFILSFFIAAGAYAQGTWTPLNNVCPDANSGVMLLLTDGSVIVKNGGGSIFDGIGNGWDRLVPDKYGSYVNGTWSTISPMGFSRLYFSSQVLKDGRVYVAGGEYGSGSNIGEIYDPITDTWATVAFYEDQLYDANSQLLPDGKVLQAIVGAAYGGNTTYIFDPVTETFVTGANCVGSDDEASWLKLPDESILFVDDYTPFFGYGTDSSSERYIPSLGLWMNDGIVPGGIFDSVLGETGPAVLLPNGKAHFISAAHHAAFYTPSGTSSAGTWTESHQLPAHKGAPDAAASVMVDGKVLYVLSDTPSADNMFPSPMTFYVYDYTTDSFTQIPAPTGDDTLSGPCYFSNTLNLPDGSILFGSMTYGQYWTFTPSGTPLAAGKPTIDHIIKISCDTYMVTGTMFNGLNQGSYYGDDWQMATNYPLVRLKADSLVYYARSYNWNRTGVMTGSLPDTAYFSLPDTLPMGTYALEVVTNGIASAPSTFHTCGTGVAQLSQDNHLTVFPNHASESTTISFTSSGAAGYKLIIADALGREVKADNIAAQQGDNTYDVDLKGLAPGWYSLTLSDGNATSRIKLIIK